MKPDACGDFAGPWPGPIQNSQFNLTPSPLAGQLRHTNGTSQKKIVTATVKN
jgi:hypothetical protein